MLTNQKERLMDGEKLYRVKFGGFYFPPDTPEIVDELGRDVAFAIEIPRFILNAIFEEFHIDPDEDYYAAAKLADSINRTFFGLVLSNPENGVHIDLCSLVVRTSEVSSNVERYISVELA